MDVARAIAGGDAPPAHRIGVVKAAPAGAKTITVDVDGVEVELPVLAASYAVGATVLVARAGRSSGYVLGPIGTAPPPDPADTPPPQPAPTVKQHTRTLLPVATGTYRAGKWRGVDELYQGDWSGHGINTGAAFYGDQIAALRAKLDRPYSAKLRYRRTRGGSYGAQTPTFWTVTERRRPAGAPSRVASAAGAAVAVDREATWTVPEPWVAELLAGTRGGLAIHVDASSPYIVLAGLADFAAAMALTVTYYA